MQYSGRLLSLPSPPPTTPLSAIFLCHEQTPRTVTTKWFGGWVSCNTNGAPIYHVQANIPLLTSLAITGASAYNLHIHSSSSSNILHPQPRCVIWISFLQISGVSPAHISNVQLGDSPKNAEVWNSQT